ncbi:MAG: hypothetical protein J0M30_14875 [Chitinophagales bacterium]|nr:hypothetical protein [Chitinophagales bacterium]
MDLENYNNIKNQVIEHGYEHDIKWQENVTECTNQYEFFFETCWVILNSGMKEQIARKIWERIKKAWEDGVDISEVFKHNGKVKAIKYVEENQSRLFEEYVLAENKIDYLKTIPFIGNITCYHLAKNLGHDCVKPDRHLVRVAKTYNETPDSLCEKISKQSGDRKCVVDIVLWRACNLGIL